MENFKEIRQLLQQGFSVNRREKAKILVKEWLMGLPLLSKKSLSLELDFPPDPKADTWSHREARSIDASFFKQGTVALVEDRIHEDGQIRVEHEYTVQQLYGASAYTNESTHRSIFNREGTRVELLSCTKSLVGSNARAPARRQLPVSKTVSGVTANLYGTVASAEGNYLHWFIDAMSRLFLIERFHSLDKIDHVLVPPLKYDFHWDSLAALGFDRSQIIELQPLECVQFECLLATSWPRGRGSAIGPSWAIDRYNETLLEKAKAVQSVAGKRVYISRRDAPSRMFLNENEVCDFFEARGYDIVELTPLNLWQKIAVFRDADIIVSQTGAGLTNLMFCHSDVKVLELVDEKFVYPLYASLAVYRGGTHHAHFFANESALGRTNAMMAKSSLAIDELEKSLVQIES